MQVVSVIELSGESTQITRG